MNETTINEATTEAPKQQDEAMAGVVDVYNDPECLIATRALVAALVAGRECRNRHSCPQARHPERRAEDLVVRDLFYALKDAGMRAREIAPAVNELVSAIIKANTPVW